MLSSREVLLAVRSMLPRLQTARPADAAERMVPMLLSKGVELDTRNDEGWTPLHYASTAGG